MIDYPWSDEHDITEDEARAVLCKELGCKPHDIQIEQRWCVVTPDPRGTHEKNYFRREAKTLRAAAWQIVTDHAEGAE